MAEVNGMSDMPANPRRYQPLFAARLDFATAHDLSVREIQVRALVDKDGGSKEQARHHPSHSRFVENGLAPPPRCDVDSPSSRTMRGQSSEAGNAARANAQQTDAPSARTKEWWRKPSRQTKPTQARNDTWRDSKAALPCIKVCKHR